MIEPYYEDEYTTLYCGDCRDVLPTLEAVDHVITDPPYGRDVYIRRVGHNTKAGSRTPDRLYKGASMAMLAAGDIGEVDEMISPCSLEFARLVTRWVIVFSDAETLTTWRLDIEGAGLRYIRTGAWVKPDPMPQFSGDRPSVGFEPCTIAHAQGPMRWNSGGLPAVWTYNTARGDARPDHPCPKPLALMKHLVLDFTDPGETILDPFCGSGTTLVAAKTLGRKAIGIELEPKWCEVTKRRLMRTEYKPPLDLWPRERAKTAALL